MTWKIFILACSLCWLAGSGTMNGQTVRTFHNNHAEFDTRDGLPQSYVSAILQDHDGFMWFSTPDGLSRYDGREFFNFKAVVGDPKSLSYNNIHDIVLDEHNRMWIVYFNGKVDLMDPRTFEVTQDIQPVLNADTLSAPFTFLNDFIRDWNVDDQGKYWFYSYQGKLQIFDSTKVGLASAYHERGKNGKVIFGYAEDPKGRLWLLFRDGFEVSDESWSSFRKIPFPPELRFDADSSLYRSLINLPGNRMMTAIREQLLIYDYETGMYNTFRLPPVPMVHKKPIRIVTKDPEGRPVIAYQGYVFRLEKNDEVTILWKCPESDYATICSLFFDKSNSLWVATNGYGLYKINMLSPAIEAHEYEVNLLADIAHNQMGVPRNNIPKSWMDVRAKQFWLRHYYDGDSNLIIVNRSDLRNDNNRVFFQKKGNEFSVLPIPEERSVVGLDGDGQGNLWALSSESHLYHWTDYDSMASFRPVASMYNDSINIGSFDLEVDDEHLWVATKFNGLYKLRRDTVVAKFLPGSDSTGIGRFELTDIVTDPTEPHILWIGTLGDGLLKWDKRTDRRTGRFDESLGLSNNNIQGIVPDRQGNLWLSTLNGLNRYNPRTGESTSYFTSDGLFEDEFQRFYYFVLPDGRFAFGSINGYSIVDPQTFRVDTVPPRIALSHFYVNNQLADYTSDGGVLSLPVNLVDRIDLDYDQNTIGFDLAVLQFNQPLRNQFKYMLEGYDTDWVVSGNDNKVRYSKLPPGSYTFRTSVSSTSGVWNPDIKSVGIVVHPPFWLTWWAYLIYGFIGLLMAGSYRRYYRKKIQKEQEYEFSQREAERFKTLNATISEQAETLKKINQTKDRLFSIISHDLRGPIASFESIAPLIKNYRQNEQPDKVEKLIDHVGKSAHSINQLLDNLLNWSLSQQGEIRLEISRLRLADTVNEVFEIYSDMAAAKNVKLKSEVGEEEILADRHTFSTVVRNLVSNALKFSSPGGEIRIKPRKADNFLQIIISDNGIGIPPERLDRLFDVDKSKVRTGTANEKGTGLGLVLVKEFVEMNKGRLELKSEAGKGTDVYLLMPLATSA